MLSKMKIRNIFRLILFTGVAAILWSCAGEDETVIVPKTLEQYKQEMLTFINAQILIVDNCVVGYNKGDFRSSTNYDPYTTAYKARLTTALTNLQKPDLTIAQVVQINTSLSVDGKNFQSSLYISDRRPLNDVIVECEALNNATLTGTAVGQASAEAKTAFANAIAAAKVVRNATTTIERQVAAEVTKMNAAKQTFQNAIVK
jgi:hypothetical protein